MASRALMFRRCRKHQRHIVKLLDRKLAHVSGGRRFFRRNTRSLARTWSATRRGRHGGNPGFPTGIRWAACLSGDEARQVRGLYRISAGAPFRLIDFANWLGSLGVWGHGLLYLKARRNVGPKQPRCRSQWQ
jgi:hypothetical protein